ncbi:hypothetical protein K788_0006709 [Paraburkholderia caribensis MBA4]|uniref:Uncharacterized protein n=1 Tax=Paraburkholderia caribensis MBA4 TaxID=1323664 RepID=A0A0P0R596_9BURK|nr:hypothetical protein K788_0006709 [Paraburkholderia caribensis MBA4]
MHQILAMQNSPHLQAVSLYGQYMRPHACPVPVPGTTRQPFASAWLSADSISFFE